MSVEMACECDGLPPHSHVYRHDMDLVSRRAVPVDTGEIRIWVDWKAVARDLAVPPPVPDVLVVQRAGSPLGLVVEGEVVEAPDALRDDDAWVTVHDWNGKLVYDGRGPVPPNLITLPADEALSGRAFTFDVRPLTDTERIDKLADTLTRPRRHDQCDTEHAPGQCLVHDKRAKNCRYDDVPAEFRLIVEGRWCEPCLREAVKEANPMPMDTPVEIAAESQRRFAEDPKFQARATMIDGIVVESVQRIFGRTLSDGERDAARFAIAVALVVAEQQET